VPNLLCVTKEMLPGICRQLCGSELLDKDWVVLDMVFLDVASCNIETAVDLSYSISNIGRRNSVNSADSFADVTHF
jgi:hypothetical protein